MPHEWTHCPFRGDLKALKLYASITRIMFAAYLWVTLYDIMLLYARFCFIHFGCPCAQDTTCPQLGLIGCC